MGTLFLVQKNTNEIQHPKVSAHPLIKLVEAKKNSTFKFLGLLDLIAIIWLKKKKGIFWLEN